jgi:hypothetical protein
MTKEEYENQLKQNAKQHVLADQKALRDYLNSIHTVYAPGTILQDTNMEVFGRVIKHQYSIGFFSRSPVIIYRCRQLTKNLKNRVNYEEVHISTDDLKLIEEDESTKEATNENRI